MMQLCRQYFLVKKMTNMSKKLSLRKLNLKKASPINIKMIKRSKKSRIKNMKITATVVAPNKQKLKMMEMIQELILKVGSKLKLNNPTKLKSTKS